MTKRFLKVALLFGLVAIALVGCKKKGKKATTQDSGEEQTISVRLLTDAAGIDDKSFNASAWRGIERFYHNPSLNGKMYSYTACKTQDEFLPMLRQATSDADDLIVASGFFWSNPINTVAKDNPNQKYLLIDAPADPNNPLPNVVNALFEEETGSYIVGVIAAKQAELEGIPNPKFGFIGGVPNGTLTRFEIGYVQGIRSVFPNAEIVDYYANSFSAPELGKVQAKNFFDSGVYCIFTAAGATGSGAIAQAKEYRLKGRNVWVIGVDSDQYEDGIYNDNGDSAVLTSMIKLVEEAIYKVLNEIQVGKFTSGNRVFDLADGCINYSIENKKLHESVQRYAEDVRQDIINHKVVVEKTYKEALKKGLVPELRAKDD